MTSTYSIRALARTDLEQIWLFTFEEWGLEQADKYLNSLFSGFELLSRNPYTGKDREDIKNGYYCFPEGMHLVFYIMTECGIDIIAIPHQNMDVVSHL